MFPALSLAALLLFPLPWFLWARSLRAAKAPLDALVDDYTLACGAGILLLWVTGFVNFHAYLALWAAALAAFFACRRRAPLLEAPVKEEKILLAGMALVTALRVLPLYVNPYPRGWDPYFHMILADGIALNGKLIETWMPFEVTQINYPLGSHVLQALIASVTRAPSYSVFSAALVFFGTLLPLQAYSLAVKAFRDREIALYAALFFAAWATYGGISYFEWGGLPNLVALTFLVAALTFLTRGPARGALRRWEIPVCVLALSVTHHHVVFTTFLVFGWLWAWARLRRHGELAARIAVEARNTLVLGSPYYALFLARIPSLSRTGSVSYIEPVITLPRYLEYFGPLYFFGIVVGATAYLLLARKDGGESVRDGIWLQTLLCLLTFFAGIDYVFRFWSAAFLGHESAPLAPARFLTDASVLACFVLALGLRALRRRTSLGTAGCASLLLVLSALNWGKYHVFLERQVTPERIEAYAWIKEHTPSDTVVLDRFVETSYFTRRASNTFPFTPSEYFADAEIMPATKILLAGQMPELFQHRKIIGVSYNHETQGVKVWDAPGLALLSLNPANR